MRINESLLDIEVIQNSKLPILDLFIRRTSVITSTPEFLVEKIIKDQWQSANTQTRPGNPISEIDFCNLGSFYISSNKARKRIAKLEKYNEEMISGGGAELKDSKKVVIRRNLDMISSIQLKTNKTKLTDGDKSERNIGGSKE